MKQKSRKFLLATGLCILLLSGILAAVFSISAEEPYEVYASDLAPLSAKAGYQDVHFDEDLSGAKLRLRNAGSPMTFTKGIFAHVDSEVTYDAEKYGIQRFTAYIGVNDGSQGYKEQASADFEVLADGKRLYKSGILRIDSKAELISVDIPAGTKVLTLITTQADDSNYADHTVWADAKFYLDPASGGVLDSISLGVPNPLVSVGDTLQASVSAIALGGKEMPSDKLDSVSYTSSSTAIATVSDKGVITAKAAGTVTITATATKADVTSTSSVTVYCVDSSTNSSFLLASPGGNLKVLLTLESGALKYTVAEGSQTIVEPSAIGYVGTGFSLTSGFSYVSKTEAKEINETYKNYSGDYATGEDHCFEQSVTFKNGDFTYTVVMRAYDDGFAVRSVIENAKMTTLTVTDEKTEFTIPTNTTVNAIVLSDADMSKTYSYESGYSRFSGTSLSGRNVMFPALVEYGNDRYALLSEAELYPEDGNVFYGSCLRGTGGGKLELASAPTASASVTVSLPYTSPWRMGVVGDLATIVESDLVDNLNVRPDESIDYSWIEPGVTAWMWLSEGFQGQRNEAILRDYVDLAAEMNWKYLILDEGWQPNSTVAGKVYNGYFPYFKDLIKYAESKGVGFIVWVKHVDLDTDAEREVLREWAAMGIKGIKADFFDTEQQVNIKDMQLIYQICAEEHLLVNFHGANKPTGERATYPNVINRESLNGQEYGGVWSTNTTIWPYTRAAIGPSDITPTLYPTASSTTTAAHQLAVNVVIESGMPCMASDTEDYRNCSVKSYFRALPAKWDDLKFISGAISQYTVLARKSGSEWWIGGLTRSEQDVAVTFDYLDEGKNYFAVLYHDGDDKNDIAISVSKIKASDVKTISMPENGGFVLRLIPEDEVSNIESIVPGKEVYTVNVGETAAVTASVSPQNAVLSDVFYEIADPSIATVSPGGTVTGKNPGITTITLKNHDGSVRATAELRVARALGYVKNDQWVSYNGMEAYPNVFFNDYPNRVHMTITTGDINGSPNLLLKDAPEGDFELTVQISGGLSKDFQSAGLAIYAGSAKIVTMERRSHSYFGGNVFCLSSCPDGKYVENYTKETSPGSVAYLKLTKKGDVYTGYYSYDGSTWTQIAKTISYPELAESGELKVGLVARSGSYSNPITVTYNDFKENGKVVPFTIYNSERTLCALIPAEDVTLMQGGTLSLPATVRGYISDGKFEDIAITWDTSKLDLSKTGTTTVTGRAAAGSPYAGSTLTASVTVTVKESSALDLTGDGVLTIADVTALLRFLAAPEEVTLVRSGDLTGDGIVNIKDVSRLLSALDG